MQRGDALTADMLDEFHGFVQEELAALLEEKNAEIAYLRAIANGKFADAAQMRLHHAGLDEDKTFVFIAAHLAAQFKAIGATNYLRLDRLKTADKPGNSARTIFSDGANSPL